MEIIGVHHEGKEMGIAELKNLPLSEKVRRYAKNIGLEFVAGTIEALTVPLMLGGIGIHADSIRERKELTLYDYRKQCEQRNAPSSWADYRNKL